MTFRFSEIEAQLSKTNTQVKQQQDRLVTDNVHLCLEILKRHHFLTCVRKTDAHYSYRLDVCRPSVTLWYCVETAQPIVKLSSLPGSSMILVL